MKKTLGHPARLGMKIREIMTRHVATIGPKASVREAAQAMRDRDVGMLPVLDGGRIVGLITDRDIVVRAIANGLDPKKIGVGQIMTTEIIYCFESEDVSDAVESMEVKQIRRLLIVNRGKRLVGVLSIGDVAVDIGDQTIAGEVLRKVSEPEREMTTGVV